ncbi:hypothetical protein N7488_009735 [Penicillium malachiteum]|nr:hypothetical protein N7488_009735 [Penicillium malachiteum]
MYLQAEQIIFNLMPAPEAPEETEAKREEDLPRILRDPDECEKGLASRRGEWIARNGGVEWVGRFRAGCAG